GLLQFFIFCVCFYAQCHIHPISKNALCKLEHHGPKIKVRIFTGIIPALVSNQKRCYERVSAYSAADALTDAAAAASTIAINEAVSRQAPPINPPSTSGW